MSEELLVNVTPQETRVAVIENGMPRSQRAKIPPVAAMGDPERHITSSVRPGGTAARSKSRPATRAVS